ncbi:MAG: amidohydrolase family protein, partial [Acidimicrobiia bacterium]
SHAVPAGLLEELRSGRVRFPHVSVGAHERGPVFEIGAMTTRPTPASLSDLGRRIAWMDEQRLDLQVVAPWLDIAGYDLPPDEGADWSRFVNQELASLKLQSDRVALLGTVPLQDPKVAGEVLTEVLRNGFAGVMIGTTVAGVHLDDPQLAPFWEAADETGSIVYLHPPFSSGVEAYRAYGLENALGRVNDGSLALARLIFSGAVERYSGARIVVSHGGAAIPYVLGRLTRAAEVDSSLPDPVAAFGRLWFDSVVFRREALELLVSVASAERVLIGSDYPFPIGDLTPRRVVEESKLSQHEYRCIVGTNACQLFGLPTNSVSNVSEGSAK